MEIRVRIFFITWVILILIGLYLFNFNKNATLKRKIWPWWIVGSGILFNLFIYWIGMGSKLLFMSVPATALISFLNIRNTSFCDKCGKTSFNKQMWFTKIEFCAKCGAKLKR
jgi:ribosomal protein L37E